MIPKVIHYCWFGKNEKPVLVKECISSWKKYLPDFKIVEWNEENYDINCSNYTRQAYQCKKWAFVSDYARFDILYQNGGLYFDVDVELLKPIGEEILNKDAFLAMEPSGKVNPGLVCGFCSHHPFIKELMDVYQKSSFLDNHGIPIEKTVNSYTSEVLQKYGFVEKDCYQEIQGISIYPSIYFCGFDLDVMEPDIHRETISIHHYLGTWTNNNTKRIVQKTLKKVIGVQNYRKLLLWNRRNK